MPTLDEKQTQEVKVLLGSLQEILGNSGLPLWSQIGVLSQIICSFAELQSGQDVKSVLLVPAFQAMVINVPLDWPELKQQVRATPEPDENLA